jgi:hypothetical protein
MLSSPRQAAEAWRPIAGRFAFTVFALDIVGTDLLALPVHAGSEVPHWLVGLVQGPVERGRPGHGDDHALGLEKVVTIQFTLTKRLTAWAGSQRQ